MGKGKKIAIGFGVLLLLFFVALMVTPSDEVSEQRSESDEVDVHIIFDGTYDELLTQEDGHKRKIVKLSGITTRIQPLVAGGIDPIIVGYNVYVQSDSEILDKTIFFKINNYDRKIPSSENITGYATFTGICPKSSDSAPMICFNDLKLTGYDFQVLDDICNDFIARQIGLC